MHVTDFFCKSKRIKYYVHLRYCKPVQNDYLGNDAAKRATKIARWTKDNDREIIAKL
jgi:hypothetical protein